MFAGILVTLFGDISVIVYENVEAIQIGNILNNNVGGLRRVWIIHNGT